MANQRTYIRNHVGSQIGKIVVDRDLCIAASSCIAVAAQTFALDQENKAVVTNADNIDDDTLTLAAQSCPTKAILLFDKRDKQIYP